MATFGAHVASRAFAGMEHMGALRNISSTCGAERVLWIQCFAANCVFYGSLLIWPFSHLDRNRHVASCGESSPLVCTDLWRKAIGQIHPLPYDAQLLRLHRGAGDSDRDDR